MSESETMILAEQTAIETPAGPDELLSSLLQLKRRFEESLRAGVIEDDAFSFAAFELMRGCCRLTGADGASLYCSKREGYLDRQAFCFDSAMDYDQMRSASQASEHVAVGQGISGFMALDASAREKMNLALKYPIREIGATSIWDIRSVNELPAQLRSRTARLQTEEAINISSMFLVKRVGFNETDYILQLVRKGENGLFSDREKLLAELFAELVIPAFRSVEDYRENATALLSVPDVPVQPQPPLEACEAIKAITIAAIDSIQKITENRK